MSLMEKVYDGTIRPHLPRKLAVWNGVVTREARLLDRRDVQTDFKDVMMSLVRESVNPDDTVVEIGSGHGVATVTAAKQATEGNVIAYEPSDQQYEIVNEAVHLNNVDDRVEVRKQVVAKNIGVYGSHSGDVVPTSGLPECDVLIMDCEGAEADIIPNLPYRPREIISQIHVVEGVNVDSVVNDLEGKSYRVALPDRSDPSVRDPMLLARAE